MNQIIKSEMKTLFNMTTGEPVRVGDIVTDFRGETCTISGGRAPHKPSSTGRVWVEEFSQEYFPGVFNLEWA